MTQSIQYPNDYADIRMKCYYFIVALENLGIIKEEDINAPNILLWRHNVTYRSVYGEESPDLDMAIDFSKLKGST